VSIEHPRAVSALSACWAFAASWLMPRAALAASLRIDVHVYDWTSLGYAAALGLLGGLLALIVSLATDTRVVSQVLKEGGRNALVSPIAGMAAYLLVEAAFDANLFAVPPVGRFLVIVGSGWAGIAFFVWLRGSALKAAQALAEWVIAKGKPDQNQT
jgi:hypothetical protein